VTGSSCRGGRGGAFATICLAAARSFAGTDVLCTPWDGEVLREGVSAGSRSSLGVLATADVARVASS
jgi:hypothetical protein